MSVQPEKFNDARAFLDALRPSSERWTRGEGWTCPWIFRGQTDATWPLIPKAWRPEGQKTLDPLKRKRRQEGENYARIHAADKGFSETELQSFAEMDAINEFAKLVDELGHPVPVGGRRPLYASRVYGDYGNYASDGLRPDCVTVGFAQHHGIPTRVLDFTRNPLVAAFFAAEETAVKRTNDGSLAVWAVSVDCLQGSNLEVLECPRSAISFLHAQDAVFLFSRHPEDFYGKNARWPGFDERLPSEGLRKLELPHGHAVDLRRLLAVERITRAHLMPTYDNVTQTLKTKWQLLGET